LCPVEPKKTTGYKQAKVREPRAIRLLAKSQRLAIQKKTTTSDHLRHTLFRVAQENSVHRQELSANYMPCQVSHNLHQTSEFGFDGALPQNLILKPGVEEG